MSRWPKRRSGTGAPDAVAPPARRLPRGRLGDARLWIGLVLVAASTVLGARLMAIDDDSVVVLRATRDLSAGSGLDGLAPVRVSRAAAGSSYISSPPPDGSVLRWPLTAGELVPRSAVVMGAVRDSREVTVAVDPLHAPPGLLAGDLVDVWSSPAEGDQGAPEIVLAGVTVAAVAADDVGLGGEFAVVLDVPIELVAELVRAARSGVVDLVAVPVRSQSPNVTEAEVGG